MTSKDPPDELWASVYSPANIASRLLSREFSLWGQSFSNYGNIEPWNIILVRYFFSRGLETFQKRFFFHILVR